MRLRDKLQLKAIPITKIKCDWAPLSKTLQLSLLEVEQKDPIKVRPIEDSEFDYEVVDGRRRLNAMMHAGIHTVLALVVQEMDDSELSIQALIANSGTPNELDEARHIIYLEEKGYTGQEIAKMTGYSSSTISQRKKLVERLHPKGQLKLQLGEIKVSTALEATKLPMEDQEELFMNGHNASYKEVFERVRNWQANQLELFDSNTDIKPGLFLTSEQVESLLSGEIVQVTYLEQSFNIKALPLEGPN